jgi:predicted dinucleotide-binding enzyme
MRIAVVGKGNVGGGLADLWERAGHEVTRIGRAGGDVGDAEVVLIAVPSAELPSAFENVSGLAGKTVIDATNILRGERPDGAESLAAYVKSRAGGGPVAKAFNLNFASLYDRLGEAKSTPGNLYCADDEAREVTEQLIRDAGYDPVSVGGLENARALEDFVAGVLGKIGRVFYRFAPAGDL